MTDMRAIRLGLKLTQTELAQRLGVSQGSICRIENGAQPLRRPLELALLALKEGFEPREAA